MSLALIKDRLLKEDHILIATHYNPDADTIGSAFALCQGLRQINKTCAVLSKDGIPKDCRFLTMIEGLYDFESLKQIPFEPELLVLVDCNSINRVSQERTHLDQISSIPTIVIDHHELGVKYGEIQWIEPETASTTMLIYRLLKELKVILNKDIAEYLYAGLCIDTGNFRHDNTTWESLLIASELVKEGVSPTKVYRALFESWSIQKFNLFKEAIKGIDQRDGIAIMLISREMLKNTGCDNEDAGNLVDFPKRAESVKVSVLMREISEGRYRVSLRSKGEVNVAKVAALYGGGGHKNAAGCTIEGNPERIKEGLFEKIKEAIVNKA